MTAALLMMLVAIWNAPPATLGEAALREAVRRQKTAPSLRVVTNESLGPMPPAAITPLPVAAAGADVRVAEPAATAAATPEVVKDAAWWRARITAARDALTRDRVRLDALQSRVSALASDIAGRDDPAQRGQLMTARQQALDELERLRKQIDVDVLAIAAIEDEARKSNVPPGWIR